MDGHGRAPHEECLEIRPAADVGGLNTLPAPLAGAVVVVTGGGHGIGRSLSLGFARAGARVVIAEVDAEAGSAAARECAAAGAEALAVATDVSDEASVSRMVEAATVRFGRVDVLVNNAAIFATVPLTRVRAEDLAVGEWERVLAVNLRGPFLCSRAVIPGMKERRAGRIVNVSSGTAFHGGGAPVHYIASKAGVLGLTRALARELGPFGITVNALAPGATVTEATGEAERGRMEATIGARAIARAQVPDDLVGAALFLASAAAGFVTGQTLVVDGGRVMR